MTTERKEEIKDYYKRKNNWKHKYSLSVKDYNFFFCTQHGLCAICKQPEKKNLNTGKQVFLTVDHNHKTEQVRALLCRRCNLMLGHCKEDIKLLLSMICYLKKFSKKENYI
jgi:hypothetical protein